MTVQYLPTASYKLKCNDAIPPNQKNQHKDNLEQ